MATFSSAVPNMKWIRMCDPLSKSINPRSLLSDRAVAGGDEQYDIQRCARNKIRDRRPGGDRPIRERRRGKAVPRLARPEGAAVSARGGGHNVASLAAVDNAVMVNSRT